MDQADYVMLDQQNWDNPSTKFKKVNAKICQVKKFLDIPQNFVADSLNALTNKRKGGEKREEEPDERTLL